MNGSPIDPFFDKHSRRRAFRRRSFLFICYCTPYSSRISSRKAASERFTFSVSVQ